MNEQELKERLDLLAELYDQRDEIARTKNKIIEGIIPPEIKQQIDEVESEFSEQMKTINENLESFEGVIKNEVKHLGQSVKGELIMAVWAKPRVTWDNKGLDGFMVAHPEIKAFRKEGEPSVSIRFNK